MAETAVDPLEARREHARAWFEELRDQICAAFEQWRRAEGRRIVLLSTKAETGYLDFAFLPGDVLLAGRESSGVPEAVQQAADASVRVPMRPGLRSLNVAVAVAMVLGEALRQEALLRPGGATHG